MGVRGQGLSLLELIIAIGVLSFALLTMMGVYLSGIRLSTRGEQITVATEVARRLMERVDEAGYAYIPEANVTYDGRLGHPRDAATGFPPPPYPSEENYRLVVLTEKFDDHVKAVTTAVYYDDTSHVLLQTYFRP